MGGWDAGRTKNLVPPFLPLTHPPTHPLIYKHTNRTAIASGRSPSATSAATASSTSVCPRRSWTWSMRRTCSANVRTEEGWGWLMRCDACMKAILKLIPFLFFHTHAGQGGAGRGRGRLGAGRGGRGTWWVQAFIHLLTSTHSLICTHIHNRIWPWGWPRGVPRRRPRRTRAWGPGRARRGLPWRTRGWGL